MRISHEVLLKEQYALQENRVLLFARFDGGGIAHEGQFQKFPVQLTVRNHKGIPPCAEKVLLRLRTFQKMKVGIGGDQLAEDAVPEFGVAFQTLFTAFGNEFQRIEEIRGQKRGEGNGEKKTIDVRRGEENRIKQSITSFRGYYTAGGLTKQERKGERG